MLPDPQTTIEMALEGIKNAKPVTTPTYEQMGEAMAVSLERIFDLMESGQLVRSTAKDHLPEWGMRSLEFVDKLAQAHKALRMWREHGA